MSNTIHSLYSYIAVKSYDEALAFYSAAFGAKEHFRLTEPDGRVGHAEVYFGSTVVMISEEFPEMGVEAPDPSRGVPYFQVHLHVDDTDAMLADAVKAGAEVLRPAEDQFFGERTASIRDPFGYRWMIGHSIEDVSTDEMQKRYENMFESNQE